MTALADAATDYLALRRRLGHDLADAHRLLPRFVAYLDDIGAATVTIEAAVAWSMAPDADPASSVWPRRMIVARGFARHMTGIDPATEVPPVGLIPSRQRWRSPFLFHRRRRRTARGRRRSGGPLAVARRDLLRPVRSVGGDGDARRGSAQAR